MHLAFYYESISLGGQQTQTYNLVRRIAAAGHRVTWVYNYGADLQHAVRGNLPEKYRSYAQAVNEQAKQLLTLRGMFRIKNADEIGQRAIPLDEVEPATEIVKRFVVTAMSLGALSPEAYQTLLQEAMEGNPTHFTRGDEAMWQWRLMEPIMARWRESAPDFPNYPAGSEGPDEARRLVAPRGHEWRSLGGAVDPEIAAS